MGGVLKWDYPQIIQLLDWDFPWIFHENHAATRWAWPSLRIHVCKRKRRRWPNSARKCDFNGFKSDLIPIEYDFDGSWWMFWWMFWWVLMDFDSELVVSQCLNVSTIFGFCVVSLSLSFPFTSSCHSSWSEWSFWSFCGRESCDVPCWWSVSKIFRSCRILQNFAEL